MSESHVRIPMGPREGYFFLLWGGASAVVAAAIAATLYATGRQALPGWVWGAIPTLGLAGTWVGRRVFKGRAFGARGPNVAMLWGVIGPSIGLMSALSATPIPAQLLLLGCGLVAHGALLGHWPLWGCGLFAVAASPALRLVEGPLQALLFGGAILTAMAPIGIHLCLRRREPPK